MTSETESSLVIEKDKTEKRKAYNEKNFVKEGLQREINLSRLEQLALPRNKQKILKLHNRNPWKKLENFNLSETK